MVKVVAEPAAMKQKRILRCAPSCVTKAVTAPGRQEGGQRRVCGVVKMVAEPERRNWIADPADLALVRVLEIQGKDK